MTCGALLGSRAALNSTGDIIPVRIGPDGFVGNKAAIGEGPQQVVKGRNLGLVVQPHQNPLFSLEGFLSTWQANRQRWRESLPSST